MKARKAILAAALAVILSSPLWAVTDSFRDNLDKEEHNQLLKALKDCAPAGEVEALYDTWIESEDDPVDLARMEYHVARYWKDTDDEETAAGHVEKGWEYYGLITEEGVRKLIPEAELTSADYYVNGGMSTGMKSSDLAKAVYKAYPDEINAILLEANRLLYTPHIAGGSPKRALAYFEVLLPVKDGLQTIDRFNLLSGLGVASEKRNKDEDALAYLTEAQSIYSGDPVITETLEKLQ